MDRWGLFDAYVQAENDYLATTNSKKALYSDDLFSEAYSLKTYDFSNFVSEIIKVFNHKAITYGRIIDHFLEHSPLPFRDMDKKRSIYDYWIQLYKKNSFITASSQSFAQYRDADNVFIQLRLPNDYLNRISELEVEQLDLFDGIF